MTWQDKLNLMVVGSVATSAMYWVTDPQVAGVYLVLAYVVLVGSFMCIALEFLPDWGSK